MPVSEASSVLVVDNGGSTLKAGFSSTGDCRLIPNCITKAKSEKRRAFVGDQIDDCRDLSSLYYMLRYHVHFLIAKLPHLHSLVYFQLPERIFDQLGPPEDSVGLHVRQKRAQFVSPYDCLDHDRALL